MPYPQYFIDVRFHCRPEMVEGVKTSFERLSQEQNNVIDSNFYQIHKDYYHYHLASVIPIKGDIYPQVSEITKDLLHVFSYFGKTN